MRLEQQKEAEAMKAQKMSTMIKQQKQDAAMKKE